MGAKTGTQLIATERRRQIKKEGWDAKHDEQHSKGQLAIAAMCYTSATPMLSEFGVPILWPWGREWWKPKTRIQNLVRAGALIAAEIDRLQGRQA